MKWIVIASFCLCAAFAGPSKRLGVPLSAEDDCAAGLAFSSDLDNCQVFYICDHGWPKITTCPGDTVWTPLNERCEDPYDAVNADCGYVAPIRPAEVTVAPGEITFVGEEWECISGDQRIAYASVCNGVADCDDGSDEIDCAPDCDPEECQLPDCKCSGPEIPGGLLAGEIGQMVIIAWDEAVRVEDYSHLYQQVFQKIGANRRREPRRNPDGCPAVGTFFVSHQFTDYAALQSLYGQGHEIAVHSISKTLPAEYFRELDMAGNAAEYAGGRRIMNELAFIPESSVVGSRAAYLQTSGDSYIRALANNNFQWDSSYPTAMIAPPAWPASYHFKQITGCSVAPCPTGSTPLMWNFPLVDFYDTNDTLCANVDSCYFPLDKEEAKELLRSNFDRHYNGNKAPFPLNLRDRWFYNNGHHNLEALQEFLDEIEAMGDVFIVTYSQALGWIKNPVPLAQMSFECDYSDRPQLCDDINLCSYFNITYQPNSEDHPGDRFFQTCAECPEEYPWL